VRILLFDNQDSFTWNLAHDLERVNDDVNVEVKTASDLKDSLNNKEKLKEFVRAFDAVVLSPGPGMPADASGLIEILEAAIELKKPLLGVCLGLQVIVEHYGGTLDNMKDVLHGRNTQISLVDNENPHLLFKEIQFPCDVGHYHSWVTSDKNFPEHELKVEARNEQGMIMAISHRTLPITGLQFHPESILTPDGRTILAGWLSSIR
jgi:anthranilate synthase component 2